MMTMNRRQTTRKKSPPRNTAARDGGEASQDFARVWGILAHIVTPTTVVAAIMMYFGAVRTNAMYRQLGVDQSMLGLSFQDYVLRSVTVAIEPLVMVLVVILVAVPAHVWLARSITQHRTATMQALPVVVELGIASAVVGVMWMAGWVKPSSPLITGIVGWLDRSIPLIMPICLGLGAFVLVYSAFLYRRVNPPHRTVNPRTAIRTDQIVQRTVCAALLLVLLLWSVTVYAEGQGREAAARYRAHPELLPSTVVYAARRLYLEGPGITETTMPDPNAMFRYRYTGLRLLIHSNRRYFLLPACAAMSSWARAIAIPADDSLRLEFSMFQVPQECPPGR
ncbi:MULTISPECIES: hypothetical protein [unclassified Nonomuraea]|uniref:hypothetical protein n=1 Tax=unclassified Nonomuraea TaxID=2593643 RepID=UPI0033DDFB74